MGIPHLITFLQPYAETESIAGRHVVIDGPGLAYHIYHACLNKRPAACNPFEAAPTYEQLGTACYAWLDGLRGNDVEIKKIYFDGFLPSSKLDTRLERLVKQTLQLSQYHSAYATPCRATFPPLKNSSDGPFHTPSVKSKLSALPPSPFLVPAILEALLKSSQYRDITEVVPGEADLYCAKYLNQHGGIVLTGDSDLLVHDLGNNGAISFFKDLGSSADGTIKSQIYQPASIAQRLSLPESRGLHAFAFELSMDSHGTFRKILVDSQALKAATANPLEFTRFLKEYNQLQAPPEAEDPRNLVLLLRSLDPRISEYVLQYPYLGGIAGREDVSESTQMLHVFLPFLLDCPARTNAWEISTVIRQLAYGLINLIVPDTQQQLTVSEHRKQQDKSSGRELQLPHQSQIPEACNTILALHSQLEQILPGLSESEFWTAFAIHQEVEYSYTRAKIPLSKLVGQQLADLANEHNMRNKRKNFTWDIIQFFAQVQGSYYSFRILKQIMSLVVSHGPTESLPEPLLDLHQKIHSLPGIRDLPGLDSVSDIIGSLGKGAVSTIVSHISRDEEAKEHPQESRRGLKKKRKRGDHSAEASAGNQKQNNPFALLGDE
ncbi:XPG domain containing domain containing protein [Hyaloscypha variabilis]